MTPVTTNPTNANKTELAPVFTPTQTFSPSPTPTETPEPVVYVAPMSYEEIVTVPVLRDQLENRFGGGYFVGALKMEDTEKYLILDFSQQGEINIIEAKDLNSNSWGLYVEKKYEGNGSGGFGDGEGVSLFVLHALYNNQEELSIKWGDLELGTKIFIPQMYIDDIQNHSNRPDGYFINFFPLVDPRFSCEEVETVPSGNGTYNVSGELCEYKGK